MDACLRSFCGLFALCILNPHNTNTNTHTHASRAKFRHTLARGHSHRLKAKGCSRVCVSAHKESSAVRAAVHII